MSPSEPPWQQPWIATLAYLDCGSPMGQNGFRSEGGTTLSCPSSPKNRRSPLIDRSSITGIYCLSGCEMLMGRWQQHLTSAWPPPLPPSVRSEHQAASQVRKAQLIWAALSAIWTGLHISFLTPSIVESSLDVIGSLFPQPNLPFPILISVGRKICSYNWPETNHILYSSVVLDSSEGRSSEPLMDGSDFLEALTKKVDSPIQTEPPMENYEAWWWKTLKGTWGSSSLELGNISWARPCVGKNWPGGNPQGAPQYCEKRSADLFDTEFPNCPTWRLTWQPL